MDMNRDEPRIGDVVLDRGRRTAIHRFDEDRGAQLESYAWVCMSEFEKGEDGVWRRPEPHGLRGLVDLELPVGESGPDDLEEAARLISEEPTRFTQDEGASVLLAQVFRSLAWMGRLNLDMLNRQGGPETVRLSRHIIQQAGSPGRRERS